MSYQENKPDNKSDNQAADYKAVGNPSERNRENIELARKAADNDEQARKEVNELLAPVIRYQTNRFCKRFCKENRYHFRCTLDSPVGSPPADASLCEWGNGSYAWMLSDLSSAERLKKYQAKNNATLFDYCYVIANSLPFYERWKTWRFGRSVHVPSYIQALGKTAKAVFYGLRSQQSIEQISQLTSRPVDEIRKLGHTIVKVLAQKNKLHLLNTPRAVSSTSGDDNTLSALESETASHDEGIDRIEQNLLLTKAWNKLDPLEQFVVEALVIDEQDAEIVLNSLRKLDLSFRKGVAAKDLDRQQLYYFRRKTLAKLHSLLSTPC